MATTAQSAILKAKIAGAIKELMIKTNAENVYIDDSTTLASKLAEIVASLNGKVTTDAMNTAISKAISDLIDGAPETYDTLKEIADYIEAHKSVETALNEAIGKKADKTTVDTLSTTVTAIKKVTDSLGSLAKKSTVSESDLDTALAAKITAGNSKSKIYYSETEPAALAEGDMWVQIV